MKRRGSVAISACLLMALIAQAAPFQRPDHQAPAPSDAWDRMKSTIEGYLGKPYAWGGTGLKSFDCSGFVWRVMADHGMLIKRTTARRLYFLLAKPAEGDSLKPGNIVFFNQLKHCGIVNDGETFYHAQSSKGTNLSRFSPFWRSQIVGFRCLTLEKPDNGKK